MIEKDKEPKVPESLAPEPGAAGSGGGTKSLDDMTLAELKAYAEEKKIPINGNKAEVLAAIKESEASGGDTGGNADSGGGEGAGD